ncbi:NRDE family protein [Aquabacterium sp. J223]|uniref:NRDE family protein n=1 Tax=Aquabacterium sp. J223 TaxID=2898431 RepID=UPI0021AD73E8|nr:NRDE family protein [Aquabacterium sp. J223]UUX94296.1 NRDE family protein [Aquabacterium sp. J223]
MCLAVLALGAHPRFPLVLASNRDEYFDRPTERMHWWPPTRDAEPVLAGRDLRGGGSWLALTPRGRLALITNVRRPDSMRSDAPSRGGLVTAWVGATQDAEAFCAPLANAGHNGFNLLMADLPSGAWHWYAPDQPAPRRLSAGLWGLSNAALDTPWPKLTGLKAALRQALDEAADADRLTTRLLAALRNDEPVPDDRLPQTGVPLAVERELAKVFIRLHDDRYGTRCSTVLVAERTAQGLVTHVLERSFAPDRSVTGEQRFRLTDWPPVA